ncbi:unnamed protein product [Chrysodeixis includens]|uniref:CHK kinase-like domain-containing protein n=1 Tax=Chrysodeixis includens TaxID=689277 RepID=A0A9P0BPJ3_CHRIL|nr:unnamed protein product [Chrysodeixis includens]
MELLTEKEINYIAKKCGFTKVLDCVTEEFPDKVLGYLGDHLKLIIEVESNGIRSKLNLFVKCMPRYDKWKAEYLMDIKFFKKEYVMLSTLFNEFENHKGIRKWRPDLLFTKEDIFVFENVALLGYQMPHNQHTMSYEDVKATVETLARFHAQSYIYEEKKSKELGRPYRIWEDYSDYLQEPNRGLSWRDTGRNAAIDYLKVYSTHRTKPNFNRYIGEVIPALFDTAMELMKPSTEYRNVVSHRDLWTNNIFLKKESGSCHALFVDYQTVVYASPMLDLSSLIYFNTTKRDRDAWTKEFIDIYYAVLSNELDTAGIDIEQILSKSIISEAYDKSLVFALTQAALITPISSMGKQKREEIFDDPESSERINVVSRSKEFIDYAKEDSNYQTRVTEVLDEIVERYVFP